MSDLEKHFPWLKRAKPIVPGKRRRVGRFMSVEERPAGQSGEVQKNGVRLGHDTFQAPLPANWLLEFVAPMQVRFQTEEGDWIEARLDSYDDPEAARGGRRALAYFDEPEFAGLDLAPDRVLGSVQVSVPQDGERDIVWKWLQPFADRYVRELTLRCRPGAADADDRMVMAEAVGEWLSFAHFAEEETALDRVAHTAELERVGFDDALLIRLPRRWPVERDRAGDAPGRGPVYAVENPSDRETLWVQTEREALPAGTEAERYRDESAEAIAHEAAGEGDEPVRQVRRETLESGDALVIREDEQPGKNGGARLRRLSWYRFGLRDDWLVVATLNLCTLMKYLDEPEQIETEALIDREIRSALMLPPPPKRGEG